jgi:hypothetical protein
VGKEFCGVFVVQHVVNIETDVLLVVFVGHG